MSRAIHVTYIACMLFLLLTITMFAGSRELVIAQIAPGVLQSAAQTATITGAVTQSDGTQVSGADVRLVGPAQLSTKSDVHGIFVFTSVPYGIYQIIADIPSLGVISRDKIAVKGDITVTIQYVAQSGAGGLKTIARVSTHSAGVQINVTPASVTSINPSDYAFQGNSSWRELLNQIPGVTVSGGLQGGRTRNLVIPDGPFQPIILSINGALPYETSTTLDGMPLENTSLTGSAGGGVDLSYSPMSMFDTADVVRGPGANAPSIVDSIGGSFVLHAPGRVEKNSFEFSTSNDPYGGIFMNAKAALRFGRFSATVTYGINDSPGPLGIQSLIGSLKPLTVNGQPFSGCTAPSNCTTLVLSPNYNGFYNQVQDSLLLVGVPANTHWTQHGGAIALSYDITPSISAQVFYSGSSSGMLSPDNLYPTSFTPGPSYTGSIAPGLHNYMYAQGLAPSSQASSLFEEKVTAYVARGVLRLAALQNNSFYRQDYPNLLPNGQYTLYGTGYYTASPNTVVNFNGVPAYVTFSPYFYHANSWVNNRDLLASYAEQVGSASAVDISYVTGYYNNPNWNNGLCCGGYAFSGSQSPAVSETTNELRFHASSELGDKLLLDASWYFARGTYHVQDPNDPTGNTWANPVFSYSEPRVGAVWRANRDIAIRAAAGGGYALPQLSQLVGSNATYLCGPYYVNYQTNLDLTPEKSFGFDVGTDIRLHHDMALSFDLYRTNLYGQFYNSTTLTGMFNGLPLYTNKYANLSQSRYEGVNLDIRHEVPKGMYWHAALGFTRAYVISVPSGFYDSPATGPNSVNTNIVPGINFNGSAFGSFGAPVPYAQASGSIGYRWTTGKYIDLSPTYYGNNNSYFEPAFVEFDAHAGYSFTKNISLLATFRNITGIYGLNYQYNVPSMAAPTIAGLPYALIGVPYGPRSVIITLHANY